MFKLISVKLAEELLKQTTKWKSYLELKDHLHALQFMRTSGPAPMLSSIERDDLPPVPTAGDADVFDMEDGDFHRLEKRDGKRVAVRVKGRSTGEGVRRGGRSPPERWRCDREGHRQDACTWATHKDGGFPEVPRSGRPTRRAPRDRSANHSRPSFARFWSPWKFSRWSLSR